MVNKADILEKLAQCIGVDVNTLVKLEKIGVLRIGIASECYYAALRKWGAHETTIVISCKNTCRVIDGCPKPILCYTIDACKQLVTGKEFVVEDLVLGLPVRLAVLEGKLFAFLSDGTYSPYTSYRLSTNENLIKIVNNFDYVCGVVFGWEEPYTLWLQPGYDKVYGFIILAAVSNKKYFTTFELRGIGYTDLLPHILLEDSNVDALEKLLRSIQVGARLGARLVSKDTTIIFASKNLVQGLARWNNLLSIDNDLMNIVLSYYAKTCLETQKNVERERVICELGNLLLHGLLEELQARESLVVELKIPHSLKDSVVAEFSGKTGFHVKGAIRADDRTVIVRVERYHPILEPLRRKMHLLPFHL